MRLRFIRWLVPLVVLLTVAPLPAPVAQDTSAVSVFSVWVRLSLRGFTQQEIESVLRNMDDDTIQTVKERLRATVLSNLELKNVGNRYQTSRDKDDITAVKHEIETEIRFAGMQNDEPLKRMIKDRFGIPLRRLGS